jgi:hypothetical protein
MRRDNAEELHTFVRLDGRRPYGRRGTKRLRVYICTARLLPLLTRSMLLMA